MVSFVNCYSSDDISHCVISDAFNFKECLYRISFLNVGFIDVVRIFISSFCNRTQYGSVHAKYLSFISSRCSCLCTYLLILRQLLFVLLLKSFVIWHLFHWSSIQDVLLGPLFSAPSRRLLFWLMNFSYLSSRVWFSDTNLRAIFVAYFIHVLQQKNRVPRYHVDHMSSAKMSLFDIASSDIDCALVFLKAVTHDKFEENVEVYKREKTALAYTDWRVQQYFHGVVEQYCFDG